MLGAALRAPPYLVVADTTHSGARSPVTALIIAGLQPMPLIVKAPGAVVGQHGRPGPEPPRFRSCCLFSDTRGSGRVEIPTALRGVVPGAGFEPARPHGQGILSPQRLPVTPSGRTRFRHWRRGSESNRRTRLCRPLHDHSATPPRNKKREVEL